MSDPRHRVARDARDRIARWLGLGWPFPLRDLEIEHPAMVSTGERADLIIRNAQKGVDYRLCDEEGNLLLDGDGKPVEARDVEGRRVLTTGPISDDVTFTILAMRPRVAPEDPLEVYLERRVSLEVGVDPTLAVRFEPSAGQVARPDGLTISFGETVVVAIDRTQEGISYQLIQEEPEPKDLGTPERGNKDTLRLRSSPLSEDAVVRVRAFRTNRPGEPKMLDARREVVVRPDPTVGVEVGSPIVEYGARPRFTLPKAQDSTQYALYRRLVRPEDYVSAQTAGALVVAGGEGGDIGLNRPPVALPASPSWTEDFGFVKDGDFGKSGGKRAIAASAVNEDAFYVVVARKEKTGDSLVLAQMVAILARPNPGPSITVAAEKVTKGSPGLVQVSGTQRRVRYQLRSTADHAPIGEPGYHFEDRGLEFSRIEVDFAIDGQGSKEVLLPTDSVNKESHFEVFATKVLTGLTKLLEGRATIQIGAPPEPPPAEEPPPVDPTPTPAPTETVPAPPPVEPAPAPVEPAPADEEQPAPRLSASGDSAGGTISALRPSTSPSPLLRPRVSAKAKAKAAGSARPGRAKPAAAESAPVGKSSTTALAAGKAGGTPKAAVRASTTDKKRQRPVGSVRSENSVKPGAKGRSGSKARGRRGP